MINDWKHVPLGKSGWPEVPYGNFEVEYSQHMGLPVRYRSLTNEASGTAASLETNESEVRKDLSA